ncbi:hypothetical protein M8J77_001706 [Diaphorina citri]|nr:hypothetical protein M8J77_001706 [Diaphorina citri]
MAITGPSCSIRAPDLSPVVRDNVSHSTGVLTLSEPPLIIVLEICKLGPPESKAIDGDESAPWDSELMLLPTWGNLFFLADIISIKREMEILYQISSSQYTVTSAFLNPTAVY